MTTGSCQIMGWLSLMFMSCCISDKNDELIIDLV